MLEDALEELREKFQDLFWNFIFQYIREQCGADVDTLVDECIGMIVPGLANANQAKA